MTTNNYEFKFIYAGDGRLWESVPVSDRRELTADQAGQVAQTLARQRGVVEVRYNAAGSLQGHYVSGQDETRQRHREMLKGANG